MEFYKDMLRRANIYQIANFVMYGTESSNEYTDFKIIEDEALKKLVRELGEHSPELLSMIVDYSVTIGDLYFTLGMRAGVKVGIELVNK